MSEEIPANPPTVNPRPVQIAAALVLIGAVLWIALDIPTKIGIVILLPLFYLTGRYIVDPLDHPPGLPRGLAWVTALMWAVFIYFTIPLARGFRKWITNPPDHATQPGLGWPRESFGWFVIGCIAVLGLLVAIYLWKRREHFTPFKGVMTVVIMTAYVWRTLELMKVAAEEAIHFLEYGVLCALFFSALSHRNRNTGAALVALVLTSTCGALDEFVQWATPNRYFDMRDIGLNAYSGLMVALLLALVLRPPYFKGHMSRATMRALTIAVLSFIGISLLIKCNTPKAISWYSEKFPSIGKHKGNWGEMTEYGYEYRTEEIGIFQSRLLPDALKQQDETRGAEAVQLLADYTKEHKDYSKAYSAFLRKYSAISDPYMHEMRVHLHSRDRNLQKRVPYRPAYDVIVLKKDEAEVKAAMKPNHKPINADNAHEYRMLTTSALKEHYILHQYFPTMIGKYRDSMTDEWLADMKTEALSSEEYAWESKVSRGLIKKWTQSQVMLFHGALALMMIVINVWYGKTHQDAEPSDA